MITVEKILKSGFNEIGNNLGAAHYRNNRVEIRHTQSNGRWWLTDGKSSYTIIKELTNMDEVIELIK